MSSEKDSYDKPSRKQAGCTSNSPQWRIRPNKQSNWPARQVGPNEHSNSQNGRVGPNEHYNSPNGRVGPNEQSNSPNGRVGPNEQSNDQLTYLRLVLVAPSFKIGSNLLLFHLDRSPEELVISYEIQIDRIKRQRLTKHVELPPLYEKFKLSLESTSFRKRSFDKSLKRLSQKMARKSPERG
ncbi:hypothetical protein DY000_02021144 [Brassica cretica]|uniref:Uncharacterized protein n=1 Tax=Brassica cretica TaxID=69181 RepID=A0ABQ7EL04_BRACR|nr:hypothetical protein DY000_02021144 [Brassica cretica]